jgi:hypothetical protein
VPSSTSSSDGRSDPRPIPGGDWRATWLVALAIAVGGLGMLEHAVRARGGRPSVADDPTWWGVFRRRADGDPRVVAFVGTSRMATAYSAEAFAEAAPDLRGVQLAINGLYAVKILQDLADDDDFRGVAVVDIVEWDVERGDPSDNTAPYLAHEHAPWRAPGELANRYLAAYAQSRFAVLSLGGAEIWKALIHHGGLPPPRTQVGDFERSFHGNYRGVDPARLVDTSNGRLAAVDHDTATPELWVADARALVDPLVARIRAHGGDVVIVRLPLSGALAAAFDQHYPRARFWDVFARTTTAVTIRTGDLPELASIVCPDDMHVDQTDQARVTRAIVTAMRARGVLRGREP